MSKKWDKENAEKIKEYKRQWYKRNREKMLEHKKEYDEKHKEEKSEYLKEYFKKPINRAKNLVRCYSFHDKEQNRGECTLTPEWIIENVFTSKCRYCGKEDWTKLGCDRINNDLPHTPDNVVCCCEECNKKKGTTPYEEYIKMLGEKNS